VQGTTIAAASNTVTRQASSNDEESQNLEPGKLVANILLDAEEEKDQKLTRNRSKNNTSAASQQRKPNLRGAAINRASAAVEPAPVVPEKS
jgi:uncharacterized protein YlxW (UPF0749 family)